MQSAFALAQNFLQHREEAIQTEDEFNARLEAIMIEEEENPLYQPREYHRRHAVFA